MNQPRLDDSVFYRGVEMAFHVEICEVEIEEN